MESFFCAVPAEVHVGDIDPDRTVFDVFKTGNRERLEKIIRTFGVPARPLLHRGPSSWDIISGTEILSIVKGLGLEKCPALVMDAFSWREYGHFLLARDLKGEISPVGKLRAVSLMRDRLEAPEEECVELAVSGLQVPLDMAVDTHLPGRVFTFPPPLYTYLETRDMGFKVIKNLLLLPREGIDLIASWVSSFQIRVNIFREIVDMLLDIIKRDGACGGLSDLLPEMESGTGKTDETLHARVRCIRYPRYSRLKEKADNVTARLRGMGIVATIPPFFEGNTVELNIRIRKGDDRSETGRKLKAVLENEVADLMELL